MRRLSASFALAILGWLAFEAIIRTDAGLLLTYIDHGDTPQAYIVGVIFGVLVAHTIPKRHPWMPRVEIRGGKAGW